ncbi:MAG: PKD domain-containing protein [Flavobacteriales bacterium]|nr:PKD domain-containing protein [Flavobacteriales bacterium]
MGKLNIDNRLKDVFDGFEPAVKGNWGALEQKLNQGSLAVQDQMIRRVRVAQRFAITATAVAAGLAFWMVYPVISETTEENLSLVTQTHQEGDEHGVMNISSEWNTEGKEELNELGAVKMHYEALLEQGQNGFTHPGSVARTTNTVKLNGLESDKIDSELSAVPMAAKATTEHVESSDPDDVVSEKMELAMRSSVQEACAGTEVEFALADFVSNGSILWNFGDGSFSQDPSPSHLFEDAGVYDITVSVRSHENGIIRTKSVEDMIVVRPKPEAKMDWMFDREGSGHGVEVLLLDETEKASSSRWIVGDVGVQSSVAILDEKGMYPINLVVSNSYGCQDVAVGVIEFGDRNDAGAPAMFSPDGDGRYDTFLPNAANSDFAPWVLFIRDEDGSLEFESRSVTNPWKGELRNGGTARAGELYNWSLEQTLPNGTKRFFADRVRIES